jgi:hypothetical protein
MCKVGESVPFLYYSRYEGGHRAAYMRFIEKKYGATRVNLCGALLSRKPVLFLMAEERSFFVIFAMLLRRLLGVRTVALLFRLRPLISGYSVVSSIKRTVLKFIKRSDRYGFISIIPSQIYPDVLTVCRYSIFDFQFWDCLDRAGLPLARDEKGMAVLGRQDAEKGFTFITSFLTNFKIIEQLGVFGKISAECEYFLPDIRRLIPTADVRNGFVSDDEIFDAYLKYKYVWCCYSPLYDQSSGILGRAIQFGNVPVVRAGSISESYCDALADEYISIDIQNEGVLSIKKDIGRDRRHILSEMPDYFLKIVMEG